MYFDVLGNYVMLGCILTFQVTLLCWVYFGSSIAAFFIALCLTDVREETDTREPVQCRVFVETFRHLWSSGYQKLLVPLTIYSGLEQGFISADFTKVNLLMSGHRHWSVRLCCAGGKKVKIKVVIWLS